jgi:NAD(P)-dependent dehydrogenase (short-subunit alcohol dehydrogenase family)
VNLSSGGHKIAPVDFGDPNYEAREYDNWHAYGQAKTANVLFSVALDRRLSSRGVNAFAVHPGNIAETDLARHLTADDYVRISEMMPLGTTQIYKSVGAGAATSAWAATAPELAGRGGIYLEDCQIAPIIDNDEEVDGGCRRWALDPDAAQRLWRLSEEIVGQSFSW